MVGPKNLLLAGQFNGFANLVTGMLTRKTAMVQRVPVLSRHHQIKSGNQLIGNWDHLMTIRHFQRTSREEVILNVDENQSRMGHSF